MNKSIEKLLAIFALLIISAATINGCAGDSDDDDDDNNDSAPTGVCDYDPTAVGDVIESVELFDGSGFLQTEGISFNDEGRLFVSTDKSIIEVFANGNIEEFNTDLENPIGLAPAPDGGIYAGDFGDTSGARGGGENDGSVWLISSAGKASVYGTGIPDPNFVTVAPDGSLLVADDFGRKIYRVPAGGGEAVVWLDNQTSPNGMSFTLDAKNLIVSQTFDLDIGPLAFDSRVWSIPVADDMTAGVAELLADFGEHENLKGSNDGMATGADGMIYVAANTQNIIYQVDPTTGSFKIFADNLPNVASLAFGQGEDFCHYSIYATNLFGGKVWEIKAGVKGAPLYR